MCLSISVAKTSLAACAALAVAGCSDLSGDPKDWLGVRPYKEVRYAATVRQALDFTCGGAALATVLKYYWGRSTSEAQVLAVLQTRYPDPGVWKAKIHDGFSFDDLEFAAKAYGFKAQGGRISAEDLGSLSGPVIVHLDKGSFQHFSVLRKMHEDQVYLSDPILGLVTLPIDRFKKEYTGAAMAIWIEGRPLPVATSLGVVRSGISAQRFVSQAFDIPRAVPPQPGTLR